MHVYNWMHEHMYAHARGDQRSLFSSFNCHSLSTQSWVQCVWCVHGPNQGQKLLSSIFLYGSPYYFWDKVSYWTWGPPSGWTDWPVSSKDLPISCWYKLLNLMFVGAHVCTSSSSSYEISLYPLPRHLLWWVCSLNLRSWTSRAGQKALVIHLCPQQ